MLILSGVSLNAIIGDNGIITNAQQANLKSGMAALEEFLQENYVENYEKFGNDQSYSTNLEMMVKLNSDWFFSTGSYNYVLIEYEYEKDGTTKTDYLKVRLIDKEGLSKKHSDITNQLVGGDAKTIDDFMNFKDVYGVTSDLKVFYCSDGILSAIGADYRNSEILDGNKEVYASSSPLSKSISRNKGTDQTGLNMNNLYSVSTLEISGDDGFEDLQVLYDLPNLVELTLENYTGSLKGIGNARNLTCVTFKNTNGNTLIDYTDFSLLTGLKQLYFYMPTDTEIDKLTKEMAKSDYSYLTTIALYGYASFSYTNYATHFDYYSEDRSTFSKLEYLNRLTQVTKHSVLNLYLQNNNISTINLDFDSEVGFNMIKGFHIFSNNLTSLSGLNNAITITDLSVEYNELNDISDVPLDSLKVFRIFGTNITSLYSLIGNNLDYLDATGLLNLDFDDTKWSSTKIADIGKIGTLILPSKYDLYFSNKATINVPSDYSSTAFENALTGNTYIQSLNIAGNHNLTNTAINNVISSLPNLHYLKANDTNLSSLSGLTNKNGIYGIDIRATSVTDISPLKNSADNNLLMILCYASNFSTASNNIYVANKVMSYHTTVWEHPFWGNGVGGFACQDINGLKKLEGSSITDFWINGINVSGTLDLTGCSSLAWCGNRSATSLTIKIPKTLGQLYIHDLGATYILPKNETIAYFNQFTSSFSTIDLNGGNINKVRIDARGSGATSNYSSYLSSVNPLEFNLVSSNGIKAGNTYSYMANWDKLQTLIWQWTAITDVDLVKSMKSTGSLVTLDLAANKIEDLTQFRDIAKDNVKNKTQNLQSVTTLNLDSNALVTIDGLTPEAFPSLTTLYLNNNYLLNTISITNDDGTTDSVKICDYLARFSTLTYIDLRNNANITDFSGLTNAGYTNSNGIFTRTLQ